MLLNKYVQDQQEKFGVKGRYFPLIWLFVIQKRPASLWALGGYASHVDDGLHDPGCSMTTRSSARRARTCWALKRRVEVLV
jgi:hypothetical protein